MTGFEAKAEDYRGDIYDGEDRFIGYWHQAKNVLDLKPKNVIEVGIGNGFFSKYMSTCGLDVITVDFNERLTPRVVGDITQLPFSDGSADVTASFEVLEHLPYDMFVPAVKELRRVSRKHVVISLPDASRVFLLHMNIYGLINKWMRLPFPSQFKVGPHVFNGEHYWEIGKREYEISRITKDLEGCGLRVLRSYRPNHAPFFHYFVLEKTG
jgi:predicted SAM-dependent methyltransferase